MKSNVNPWVFISAVCATGLLFMASCEKTPQSTPPTPVDANQSVTADEVKKEAGEAAETTKEYLDQKKDEFMASMQTKLDEMDLSMEKMKAEGAELKGEAKEDWDAAMDRLVMKRAEFAAKMKTWKQNSGEAWEEAKHGAEKAWLELNTAKTDAMEELGETNLTDQEPTGDSPE